MNIIDTRRFFRNRIDYYAEHKDSHCVLVYDGSPLTLRELSNILQHDQEPFPAHYDDVMRVLCSDDYLAWSHESRTYGHAARLLNRLLAIEGGTLPPVTGRWVNALFDPDPAAVHPS